MPYRRRLYTRESRPCRGPMSGIHFPDAEIYAFFTLDERILMMMRRRPGESPPGLPAEFPPATYMALYMPPPRRCRVASPMNTMKNRCPLGRLPHVTIVNRRAQQVRRRPVSTECLPRPSRRAPKPISPLQESVTTDSEATSFLAGAARRHAERDAHARDRWACTTY